MPSNKKFDLEGFSVDKDNKCTAEGGFDGGIITNSIVGNDELYIDGGTDMTIDTASLVFAAPVWKLGDDLPASDPLVNGQIWNNAGVLTVSTGS